MGIGREGRPRLPPGAGYQDDRGARVPEALRLAQSQRQRQELAQPALPEAGQDGAAEPAEFAAERDPGKGSHLGGAHPDANGPGGGTKVSSRTN